MIVTTRIFTVLKILLLTLFVAGQGLGHAHAVDHLVTDDSTFCSICSVTGPGDCAIVDSNDVTAQIQQSHAIPAYADRTARFDCKLLADARAPPLS